MKTTLKKKAGLIFGNKLIFSWSKHLNKGKLIILCYHRVVQKEEAGNIRPKGMCVDVESFAHQMRFLKGNYGPISETEIISALEGRERLPDYAVWVTFDDGYKDNYINAYPILKKYQIPATFFVTTGYINKEVVPPDVRRGNADNLFMSWDEIREMRDNAFSIGAHTINHKILSTLSEEDITEEILESKGEIEQKLNKKVLSFAYPNGKRADYDQRCIATLKNNGFKLAVTTEGGFNLLIPDTSFNLRRVGLSCDDSFSFFKVKIGTGGFWQK